MLEYLHIENIAVIEKSDIEFKTGFNVLSGETGAGKSIVIDAINAVLGERTSRSLIRAGASRATVSARFCKLGSAVKDKLTELSFSPDEDGALIIQRVINTDGNGSIKLNGQPVTASVLREIASILINIHGQHDNQSLLNPETHYKFVDMVADNQDILERYRLEFENYRRISRSIKNLQMDEQEKMRKSDLLKYQIEEITAAAVVDGEAENIKHKLEISHNYERVIKGLNTAITGLDGYEDTDGAVSILESAANAVRSAGAAKLNSISERLQSVAIEAGELCTELKSLTSEVDFDPAAEKDMEDRLEVIRGLMSKYGGSEASVLSYLDSAQQEYEDITSSSERIAALEAELETSTERLISCGELLTQSRKKASLVFSDEVCEILRQLDMPYVHFEVDFKEGKYTKTGHDVIEFLISANVGENPRSLAKIASGGELSRIMLAIKSVLADKDDIETLIFDEIDTGISGRAARKVGEQLKCVSAGKQVICVTHLAQIAAKADNHYYIEKKVCNGRTFTDITELDFEGRKAELARIIGGKITELTLKSAEEMLNN